MVESILLYEVRYILTRTGRTVLATQETVQQLRDKHPLGGEIDNDVVSEEEYQEMLKYVAPFDKQMHVEAQPRGICSRPSVTLYSVNSWTLLLDTPKSEGTFLIHPHLPH